MTFARSAAVLGLLALTAPLFAITYVVPPDRPLIQRADAIVVVTVEGSRVRAESDAIETVTTLRVDEVIKGPVGRSVDVVEPGGVSGDSTFVVAGAPTFTPADRLVLLLKMRPDGEWAVADFALGFFAFRRDTAGHELLVRDESELVGWDSQLRPYVEPRRSADRFLAFMRDEVRGLKPAEDYFVPAAPLLRSATESKRSTPNVAPYTAASYTLDSGLRWPDFNSAQQYFSVGTEPGAPNNGISAVNAALNAWKNISGTNIKLSYAGATGSDTGIRCNATGDHKNAIQFERDLSCEGINPFTCSAGSFSGVLGIGGAFSTGTHTGPNGETFGTIIEGDVEMNQGIANCTLLFNNGDFNTGVAHEVGHSLGFRHSDQNPSFGACSGGTMACSNSAIMRSFVTLGINASPRTWDIDAAQAVYPGAVVCTAPGITTQPAGSTISSGNQASLSVTPSGTAPFTYIWYVGNPPSTTTPVPSGTTQSIQVSPSTTTNYWVRVTNSCGSVDSDAATVTIGCPAVTVNNPTATDVGNNSFQLSVVASGGSGLTYAWFQGSSVGSGVQVGTGNPFTVSNITSSTSFWVQVTNSCNNTGTSRNVVTVGGAQTCNPVSVLAQPQDQSVLVGATAQLSVGVLGTAPFNFLWYQGAPPDTSSPVGNQQTITSPVINNTTTFYAKISNCGGTATSRVVTITATTICTAPAIQSTGANPQTAAPGATITLSVAATGSSLTYQWYRGTSGDTSSPISGATSASITDNPAVTTSYWVKVSSGCGANAANSQAVIVTINTVPICVPPAIVQPADSQVLYGQKATLTVATTAGSEPLHYSWFQGAKFDTSHPIGTDSPTITTPSALTADTQFFVNVSNSCQNANSETITVKVELPRRRPTGRH